ncbi:MAG TPA: hypothetical protein PLD23_18335 [Armatimonadota bacterium]|nr:hypothetical protein [Armatimonadota bacterium]
MPSAIQRKALIHEAFGLCVLLPKTHWRRAPEPGGSARVLLNGAEVEVTVRSEECDCRGTGAHEHRFLALPAGVAGPGETLTVEV